MPVGLGIGIAIVAIPLLAIVAKKVAPDVAAAINPLNTNNAFHTGANAVLAYISGDPGKTVGNSWFETINPWAVAREREAIYGKNPPGSVPLPPSPTEPFDPLRDLTPFNVGA